MAVAYLGRTLSVAMSLTLTVLVVLNIRILLSGTPDVQESLSGGDDGSKCGHDALPTAELITLRMNILALAENTASTELAL